MSLNRFLQDLATTVAGGAERRFARDLARTLGFRVAEPEHGTKPMATPAPATPTPLAPAPPTAPPHVDRQGPAFAAGVAAGRAWGFGKAYRSDLERLAQWAQTVGERFTGRDVAAVAFAHAADEWVRADADKLATSGHNYAAGFVEGARQVLQHERGEAQE